MSERVGNRVRLRKEPESGSPTMQGVVDVFETFFRDLAVPDTMEQDLYVPHMLNMFYLGAQAGANPETAAEIGLGPEQVQERGRFREGVYYILGTARGNRNLERKRNKPDSDL